MFISLFKKNDQFPKETQYPSKKTWIIHFKKWKGYTKNIFKTLLKNVIRKANLKNAKYLKPHSLRIGCATDLRIAGVQEKIIQVMLRHKFGSRATKYYDRSTTTHNAMLAYPQLFG